MADLRSGLNECDLGVCVLQYIFFCSTLACVLLFVVFGNISMHGYLLCTRVCCMYVLCSTVRVGLGSFILLGIYYSY